MVNVALLDKVMEHIKNDLEHWNQRQWRTGPDNDPFGERQDRAQLVTVDGKDVLPVTCDTAFCFAGWAVQLSATPERPALWANVDDLWADDEDDQYFNYESLIPAEERARQLLGLDVTQAGWLFDGDNDLDDLERTVRLIKRDEGL